MTDIHPLDDALVLTILDDDRVAARTTAPYANMVGPFGGTISALFLKAVISDPRTAGNPVALTVNFCGAISDGSFEIGKKLQRAGKYLQHWSLELLQNDGVRATASIVVGHHDDVFSHQIASPPEVPGAEEVPALPGGLPLAWIARYKMHFVEGGPNFTGKEFSEPQSGRSVLWLSDEPARSLDYCALAAMADSFFLRNLQVRGTFPPMGTVTLTTYFHATLDEVTAQGTAPLLGTADCKRLHANFSDQQVELWGKDGVLLATSVQLAWYKF
ncbi:MAG: thioesterase family protein [Pseudomonadota bacterium]